MNLVGLRHISTPAVQKAAIKKKASHFHVNQMIGNLSRNIEEYSIKDMPEFSSFLFNLLSIDDAKIGPSAKVQILRNIETGLASKSMTKVRLFKPFADGVLRTILSPNEQKQWDMYKRHKFNSYPETTIDGDSHLSQLALQPPTVPTRTTVPHQQQQQEVTPPGVVEEEGDDGEGAVGGEEQPVVEEGGEGLDLPKPRWQTDDPTQLGFDKNAPPPGEALAARAEVQKISAAYELAVKLTASMVQKQRATPGACTQLFGIFRAHPSISDAVYTHLQHDFRQKNLPVRNVDDFIALMTQICQQNTTAQPLTEQGQVMARALMTEQSLIDTIVTTIGPSGQGPQLTDYGISFGPDLQMTWRNINKLARFDNVVFMAKRGGLSTKVRNAIWTYAQERANKQKELVGARDIEELVKGMAVLGSGRSGKGKITKYRKVHAETLQNMLHHRGYRRCGNDKCVREMVKHTHVPFVPLML